MLTRISQLFQHATRFSTVCCLCKQFHRNNRVICKACTLLFEHLEFACQHCAAPLLDLNPSICGACCVKRPYLDHILVAYRFSEPLRILIHAFKYQSALYVSALLVDLMMQAKKDHYHTECLIPVPMHSKRLRERGFNQAALLALHLGKKINKPVELFSCEKIIATVPQAGLPAKQRQVNLKNAFKVRMIPYQHVTLIDDIYTTGATANELAKTLKRQGVARVDLWCCARVC